MHYNQCTEQKNVAVNRCYKLTYIFCLHFIFTVGSPIPVEKVVNPSQETINELHSRYIKDVKELYEKHVNEYHPTDKSELIIA